MTAIAMKPVGPIAESRMLGLFALLASVIVLAQTVEQSDLSVSMDDLQKQEIYASGADDWRKTAEPVDEDGWREEPKKPEATAKSRMEFGYKSVYDDPRLRRDQTMTTTDIELEKHRPSSAFQIKF